MASKHRKTWLLLCYKCEKLGVQQPKLTPCQVGEGWSCSIEHVYSTNATTACEAMVDMLGVLSGWEACLANQGCKDLITVSAICGAKEHILDAFHRVAPPSFCVGLYEAIINNEFATLLEESCKTT